MVAKLGAIGSEDPVFLMTITDPVEVPCCHKIFQNDNKEGIYKWLETHPSCPNCRAPLTAENVRQANRVDAVARCEFEKRARSLESSAFVLTPCGHKIARDFMTSWLKDNHTCPHDNTPVNEALLLPFIDDEPKEKEPPKRQKVNDVAQAIFIPAPVRHENTPLTQDILQRKFSFYGQLHDQRQEFAKFSSQVVQKAIEDNILYTPHHFHLLSNEQLSQLQLSKMRREQVKNLFYYDNQNEENRRRCGLIAAHEVQQALALGLPCHAYLSVMQLSALGATKELVSQCRLLIPYGDTDESKRRMAALSVAFIQKAVEEAQLNLDYQQFSLLSDEQLRALPLSKMTRTQVSQLFSFQNTIQENRRRCGLIAAHEVQQALALGLPCHAYLSVMQLSALGATKELVSQCRLLIPYGDTDESKRRVAALSVAFIQKAVEEAQLTQDYQFNLLSNEQLRALPLSKMTAAHVRNLFHYSNGENENRRRLNLIAVAEVETARQRGLPLPKVL